MTARIMLIALFLCVPSGAEESGPVFVIDRTAIRAEEGRILLRIEGSTTLPEAATLVISVRKLPGDLRACELEPLDEIEGKVVKGALQAEVEIANDIPPTHALHVSVSTTDPPVQLDSAWVPDLMLFAYRGQEAERAEKLLDAGRAADTCLAEALAMWRRFVEGKEGKSPTLDELRVSWERWGSRCREALDLAEVESQRDSFPATAERVDQSARAVLGLADIMGAWTGGEAPASEYSEFAGELQGTVSERQSGLEQVLATELQGLVLRQAWVLHRIWEVRFRRALRLDEGGRKQVSRACKREFDDALAPTRETSASFVRSVALAGIWEPGRGEVGAILACLAELQARRARVLEEGSAAETACEEARAMVERQFEAAFQRLGATLPVSLDLR